MVVYDITNNESFTNIQRWLQEIDRFACESVNKILLGNKSDLENERKVPTSEGKRYADQLKLEFLETSAKSSVNVEEAFKKMAHCIKNNLEEK